MGLQSRDQINHRCSNRKVGNEVVFKSIHRDKYLQDGFAAEQCRSCHGGDAERTCKAKKQESAAQKMRTAMMSGLLVYLVMFIWFCVTSMIAACSAVWRVYN